MSESEKAVKKKVSPKVWRFYRVEAGKLIKIKKECPRCGRGYFLGEHADRYTCGKCGYTEYKKK